MGMTYKAIVWFGLARMELTSCGEGETKEDAIVAAGNNLHLKDPTALQGYKHLTYRPADGVIFIEGEPCGHVWKDGYEK